MSTLLINEKKYLRLKKLNEEAKKQDIPLIIFEDRTFGSREIKYLLKYLKGIYE